MATTADQLPDDLAALKAMVLAREVENERLRQIIKALQRHRFGRRAETLPEDQLLLGLEEAEQIEAAGEEAKERSTPEEQRPRTARRRTNRGSLPAHLPRVEMVVDIEDRACPCCRNSLQRPIAHLAGFSGILQVDGYGGYRTLAEKNGVTLAFCWSHVRGRFYELAAAGPAPIAGEALTRIAELYRIESDIRGRSASERRVVRQEESKTVIAGLEPWLREKLGLISQKTKLTASHFGMRLQEAKNPRERTMTKLLISTEK